MATFLSLSEAVAEHVRDGDTVAMEGFTHLIPFAAGHEADPPGPQAPDADPHDAGPDLRPADRHGRGRKARLLLGRQSRRRLAAPPARRGRERLAAAAGARGAFATPPWRTPTRRAPPTCPSPSSAATRASTCPRSIRRIRSVTCPYTGEVLATVPAIRPDVAIIHALRADRAGNVLLEGIVGVQKEAVLAAKRSIVTVEEVVEDFGPRSANAVILPAWTVSRHRDRAGRRLSRPMRTATTSAPTPSTRPGTRSPATATRSSPGCETNVLERSPQDFARSSRSIAACEEAGRA